MPMPIITLTPPAGYLKMFRDAESMHMRLLSNKELGEQLRQGGLSGKFWARQLVLVSHRDSLRQGYDYVDTRNNFLLRAPLLDHALSKSNATSHVKMRVVLVIDPLGFEEDSYRGEQVQVVQPLSIVAVDSPVSLTGHWGKADGNGFPTYATHMVKIREEERVHIYLREGICPILRGSDEFLAWNMLNLLYRPSHKALALASPI